MYKLISLATSAFVLYAMYIFINEISIIDNTTVISNMETQDCEDDIISNEEYIIIDEKGLKMVKEKTSNLYNNFYQLAYPHRNTRCDTTHGWSDAERAAIGIKSYINSTRNKIKDGL